MPKLVTIYESYIDQRRPSELRLATPMDTAHAIRARRVAEEHLQRRFESPYEEWATEELCARARLLGIDVESIGTRDRLITAIRRASRKAMARKG
jgi:hypothetical protein